MSAPMKKFLTKVVPQISEKPVGSVIFLHGSGDTGAGVQEWVNNVLGVRLSFPHLRLLYPTAPARPYTPMGGQYSNVWYNRQQISPSAPDDESVDTMASALTELIHSESQLGIPLDKIVVGGFSMGGGMALHLGYRYMRDLAGIFALSSFLGTRSLVYEALKTESTPAPLLFQSHGESDELVHYSWGKDTYQKLTSLGVKGQFHSIPETAHEMDRENLQQLCEWITKLVPVPPKSPL